MAGPAVGLDEFGNQVDAQGRVVVARPSDKESAAKKGFFGGGIPPFALPGLDQQDIDARRLKRYKSMTPEQKKKLPPLAKKRAEALMAIESYSQEVSESGAPLASLPTDEPAATTQAPGVTFATTPEEADPQEAPMSGFDEAKGRILTGMRKLESATEAEKAAMRDKLKAEQEGLDKIAQEEMNLANQIKNEQTALKALQKAHQDGLDKHQKETEALESDYNNSKIDPNRAFSSTGSRVASAIAIALGAFAQGMSRNKIPNTALQIIEGAIKNDIDAQKTEMQKKRDVLLNRNNIYARMMARFQNEEAAFHSSMALGYKHAKAKIAAMVKKHQSANAQQALNVSMAAMDTKEAMHLQQSQKALAEISVREAQFQAKAATSRTAQAKRSDSILLAQKTLQMLPRAAQQFGNLSAMEGLADALIPDYFQELFGGMKGVVTYKDTRNLSAKMITKAFDGGRPTEKDFQIFVAMFPGAKAERELGLEKFNNIAMVLNEIVVREGGLKPGALTRAWESQYGENVGLTEKDKAEGSAIYNQAEAQKWGFQPGTQGN